MSVKECKPSPVPLPEPTGALVAHANVAHSCCSAGGNSGNRFQLSIPPPVMQTVIQPFFVMPKKDPKRDRALLTISHSWNAHPLSERLKVRTLKQPWPKIAENGQKWSIHNPSWCVCGVWGGVRMCGSKNDSLVYPPPPWPRGPIEAPAP